MLSNVLLFPQNLNGRLVTGRLLTEQRIAKTALSSQIQDFSTIKTVVTGQKNFRLCLNYYHPITWAIPANTQLPGLGRGPGE